MDAWELRVQVLQQGHETRVERFRSSPVRLGARADNDLVLLDPHVSGHHAEVRVEGGRIHFRDHSTNGSFVGSERLTERILEPGVEVRVRPFGLRFELERAAAVPAPTWRGPVAPAPPAPAARLVVVAGPRDLLGASLAVPLGSSIVGRSPGADLVIRCSTVSRRHARLIVAGDGEIRIEDLESRNGTFVDGAHSRSAVVRPGDRISFGADVTVVMAAASGAEPPVEEALPQPSLRCERFPLPGGMRGNGLRLLGRLNRQTVSILAGVLGGRAPGAIFLDLGSLESVDRAGLDAIRGLAATPGVQLRLLGVDARLEAAVTHLGLRSEIAPLVAQSIEDTF